MEGYDDATAQVQEARAAGMIAYEFRAMFLSEDFKNTYEGPHWDAAGGFDNAQFGSYTHSYPDADLNAEGKTDVFSQTGFALEDLEKNLWRYSEWNDAEYTRFRIGEWNQPGEWYADRNPMASPYPYQTYRRRTEQVIDVEGIESELFSANGSILHKTVDEDVPLFSSLPEPSSGNAQSAGLHPEFTRLYRLANGQVVRRIPHPNITWTPLDPPTEAQMKEIKEKLFEIVWLQMIGALERARALKEVPDRRRKLSFEVAEILDGKYSCVCERNTCDQFGWVLETDIFSGGCSKTKTLPGTSTTVPAIFEVNQHSVGDVATLKHTLYQDNGYVPGIPFGDIMDEARCRDIYERHFRGRKYKEKNVYPDRTWEYERTPPMVNSDGAAYNHPYDLGHASHRCGCIADETQKHPMVGQGWRRIIRFTDYDACTMADGTTDSLGPFAPSGATGLAAGINRYTPSNYRNILSGAVRPGSFSEVAALSAGPMGSTEAKLFNRICACSNAPPQPPTPRHRRRRAPPLFPPNAPAERTGLYLRSEESAADAAAFCHSTDTSQWPDTWESCNRYSFANFADWPTQLPSKWIEWGSSCNTDPIGACPEHCADPDYVIHAGEHEFGSYSSYASYRTPHLLLRQAGRLGRRGQILQRSGRCKL